MWNSGTLKWSAAVFLKKSIDCESFDDESRKFLHFHSANHNGENLAETAAKNGAKLMDDATTTESREFSNEELCRLLSYLEGEVQARDIVIATFKVHFYLLLKFILCARFGSVALPFL